MLKVSKLVNQGFGMNAVRRFIDRVVEFFEYGTIELWIEQAVFPGMLCFAVIAMMVFMAVGR